MYSNDNEAHLVWWSCRPSSISKVKKRYIFNYFNINVIDSIRFINCRWSISTEEQKSWKTRSKSLIHYKYPYEGCSHIKEPIWWYSNKLGMSIQRVPKKFLFLSAVHQRLRPWWWQVNLQTEFFPLILIYTGRTLIIVDLTPIPSRPNRFFCGEKISF